MKRGFTVAMAFILAFVLVSCGANAKPNEVTSSQTVNQESQKETNEEESSVSTDTAQNISYENLDSFPASAEDDFHISRADGGVCIDGYIGNDAVVVIPDSFGGDAVVAINDSAFANKEMVAVVMPSSVTKIGDYVFHNCTKLKYAKMNEGIETYGKAVFSGCTVLEKADVPDSVTSIAGYMFLQNEALREVYIPASVVDMPKGISRECPNLIVVTPAGSLAEEKAIEEGLEVKNP